MIFNKIHSMKIYLSICILLGIHNNSLALNSNKNGELDGVLICMALQMENRSTGSIINTDPRIIFTVRLNRSKGEVTHEPGSFKFPLKHYGNIENNRRLIAYNAEDKSILKYKRLVFRLSPSMDDVERLYAETMDVMLTFAGQEYK